MDFVRISGKQRNYIFLATVIIISAMLVWAYQAGQKQDLQYKRDVQAYNDMMNCLEQQQYQRGLDTIEQMSADYQNSWQVLYIKGYFLMQLGKYSEASTCLNQAAELHPYITASPQFLTVRADLSLYMGNTDEALEYLDRAEKETDSPEILERINYLRSKAIPE